jgi:prepilin-type processing-associated H-X9-DG protein
MSYGPFGRRGGSPGVWVQEGGVWTDHWSVDPASPERHSDGRNFIFADGHAHFLRPLLQGAAPGGQHARSGYYPKARLE